MTAFAHPQRGGLNGALTCDVEGASTTDASLRLRILSCGRIGYVRVAGPLDMEASGPFRQKIQGLWDGGCRALVLDLSRVQFVDSQGIRALLSLRDEAEKRRAWLRMVIPQGSPVERTLRLLRFESLFTIFSSASSAWRRRLSRESRKE